MKRTNDERGNLAQDAVPTSIQHTTPGNRFTRKSRAVAESQCLCFFFFFDLRDGMAKSTSDEAYPPTKYIFLSPITSLILINRKKHNHVRKVEVKINEKLIKK